ncbi:hypothetical protein SAMN04487912_103452 [Arthrobacter sp. cf158]|nr:hypothetical protein SAMN04487912_103452 [Arthrobacter sp. cf158]
MAGRRNNVLSATTKQRHSRMRKSRGEVRQLDPALRLDLILERRGPLLDKSSERRGLPGEH